MRQRLSKHVVFVVLKGGGADQLPSCGEGGRGEHIGFVLFLHRNPVLTVHVHASTVHGAWVVEEQSGVYQ